MSIDYHEIIENLTEEKVKSILSLLKIEYEDKGDYLLMPTYCHNHKDEEASHKLYYYKNNKIFMCYTECGGQSIFTFLKNYYNAQNYEYDWYNDIYLLICEDREELDFFQKPTYESLKNKYSPQIKNKSLHIYNKNCLDCFIKSYPIEWLNDNISKDAMDKYNILYSISQNKIIIPHYDINNNLIGIRGRALNDWEVNEVGKYSPVWINGKCYNHPLSLNLYGLNLNQDNIRKNKICYIGESEKFCMQMESFSIDNCSVAVCGSNLNKYQLNLLMKTCAPSEIVICFDNEEKDNSGKYLEKLWKVVEKYKNYCNISFIYDRKNLTPKKASPTDCGEQIFLELLKTRVRI